jgi:hypothetical protein
MHKAVIIKATGEKSVVEFNESTAYATLSGAVGGWIECVGLENGLDLWVNEEGKLTGLPQNPVATALWADSYGMTDVIMGDVIITSGTDNEGNTLGLNEEQVDELMDYTRELFLL